jgi:hypothetical protein
MPLDGSRQSASADFADVERDRHAVAHDIDVTNPLLDPANSVRMISGLCLCVLERGRRSGEHFDQIAWQRGAIWRDEGRGMFAGKIAGDPVMVTPLVGPDKIRAGGQARGLSCNDLACRLAR